MVCQYFIKLFVFYFSTRSFVCIKWEKHRYFCPMKNLPFSEVDALPWRRLGLLATVLFSVGYLYHLGLQPLYLEEPRRAMVAMEMDAWDNWLVPRQLGEYYYNKPPLFNWVLLFFAKLAGGFHAFALRLPTVLSVAAVAWGIWRVTKERYTIPHALLAALLFITSGSILFYFGALAEIDLFYALLCVAGMYVFFYYYEKQQWLAAFALSYLLAALGFLTKGLTSIVLQGLLVLVWVLHNRQWRLLFSWQHVAGGLVFLFLVAAYFLGYNQYNSAEEFLFTLWNQSSERTVLETSTPLWEHLFTFPLDLLKDMLPGSLLILTFFDRRMWKQAWENRFLRFCLLMVAVQYIPYALSPGAKQRYIYMLHPFLTILMAYAYCWRWQYTPGHWSLVVLRWISLFFVSVLGVGCWVILWIPDFSFIPELIWVSVLGSIACVGLWVFYIRSPKKHRNGVALFLLLLGAGVARLLFDATVLPQRAFASGAQRDRQKAETLVRVANGRPVYLLGDARISFAIVHEYNYLQSLKYQEASPRQLLTRIPYPIEPDALYILPVSALGPAHRGKMRIEYDGVEYVLAELENRK